jgi:hypothetical protein
MVQEQSTHAWQGSSKPSMTCTTARSTPTAKRLAPVGAYRACAVLMLSLLSLCALAQSEPAIFIPRSPLNATEVANQKERLQRDTALSDAEIDNLLKDEANYHTYRESDIVAAFPELRGDKKLSECSNSIMGGATELVFLSDARDNEVTIKTVRCTRVDNGLSCAAVRRVRGYFIGSPEHFFSLENLTLREARTILEAYKANRIAGLSDWFGGSRLDVKSIEALPDGRYRMQLGDVYCAGCVAGLDVRVETNGSESRLVVVGDPEARCF